MNMHVALAPSVPTDKVGRNDQALIRLCKSAHQLFKREHAAMQRLFAIQDRKLPDRRQVAHHRTVMDRLTQLIAEICKITARTPEGLAYKAAMLQPWIVAGFGLDDGGPGLELAQSIAEDARRVGIDAHMDLQRLRSQQATRSAARPPRSEDGNPAHH